MTIDSAPTVLVMARRGEQFKGAHSELGTESSAVYGKRSMSSYSVADLLTPTESTTSDKRSEDHCDDVENGEPGDVALVDVLKPFHL